jgi:hypothetical protein
MTAPAALTAAGQILRAAELLEGIERQEEELARIRAEDADQHLQLAATGALGSMSRDRQWSCELATAHALTAIALCLEPLLEWDRS